MTTRLRDDGKTGDGRQGSEAGSQRAEVRGQMDRKRLKDGPDVRKVSGHSLGMPRLPAAFRRRFAAASVGLNPSARRIRSTSAAVAGFAAAMPSGIAGNLGRFEIFDVALIIFQQILLSVDECLLEGHPDQPVFAQYAPALVE